MPPRLTFISSDAKRFVTGNVLGIFELSMVKFIQWRSKTFYEGDTLFDCAWRFHFKCHNISHGYHMKHWGVLNTIMLNRLFSIKYKSEVVYLFAGGMWRAECEFFPFVLSIAEESGSATAAATATGCRRDIAQCRHEYATVINNKSDSNEPLRRFAPHSSSYITPPPYPAHPPDQLAAHKYQICGFRLSLWSIKVNNNCTEHTYELNSRWNVTEIKC